MNNESNKLVLGSSEAHINRPVIFIYIYIYVCKKGVIRLWEKRVESSGESDRQNQERIVDEINGVRAPQYTRKWERALTPHRGRPLNLGVATQIAATRESEGAPTARHSSYSLYYYIIFPFPYCVYIHTQNWTLFLNVCT